MQLLAAKAKPENNLVLGKNDLMLAVSAMSLATLKHLVDAGASITMQDNAGHDALWYAITSAKVQTVDYLRTATKYLEFFKSINLIIIYTLRIPSSHQ